MMGSRSDEGASCDDPKTSDHQIALRVDVQNLAVRAPRYQAETSVNVTNPPRKARADRKVPS